VGSAAALDADRALRLTAVLPLAQRVPLVVLLLAPGDRELDLGAAVLEVQGQGHEGLALLPDRGLDPLDLEPVEQQLAVRRGAWLVQVPWEYSGMWTLSSQISPLPSTSANPSTRDARPARSAFTSVPVSTRPASKVSSTA